VARHQEENIRLMLAFITVFLGNLPQLGHQLNGSLLVDCAQIPGGQYISHQDHQGRGPQHGARGSVTPAGQNIRDDIQTEGQQRGHEAKLLVFHGTQNHQSQKYGNQELFANWILARLPHSFDYAKDEGQGIDSQNCGQSHGEVPVPRM